MEPEAAALLIFKWFLIAGIVIEVLIMFWLAFGPGSGWRDRD